LQGFSTGRESENKINIYLISTPAGLKIQLQATKYSADGIKPSEDLGLK